MSPGDSLETRFGDQLDALDESIFLAEKSGDVGVRVALLRERSAWWFALAQELGDAGRDDVAARLAGQSDLWSVSRLTHGML